MIDRILARPKGTQCRIEDKTSEFTRAGIFYADFSNAVHTKCRDRDRSIEIRYSHGSRLPLASLMTVLAPFVLFRGFCEKSLIHLSFRAKAQSQT